jgi:hypothetical protein
MRLSTNRWYSPDNQREIGRRAHKQSSGTRRVIGLSLLLVLVIVCMTQLSDPKKYEPAFNAIGLTKRTLDPIAKPIETALDQDNSAPAIDSQDIQWSRIWYSLLQPSTRNELKMLARVCFLSEPSSQSIATELDDAWLKRINATLASWQQANDQLNQASIDAALASFRERWTESYSLDSRPLSLALMKSLCIALDRKLLDQFEDVSLWQTNEAIAFARSLQLGLQSREIVTSDASTASQTVAAMPLVDIPLLTQQANQVRGRIVRFRGEIASIEPEIVRKSTSLGDFQYQIIWIRPEQIGQTPICVYLPIDDAMRALNDRNTEPIYEFVGIPIKRLAYMASEGIEVAPVIIGVGLSIAKEAKPASAISNDSKSIQALMGLNPNLLKSITFDWQSPDKELASLQAMQLLVNQPIEAIESSDVLQILANPISSLDEATIQKLLQLQAGIERTKANGRWSSDYKVKPGIQLAEHTARVTTLDTIEVPKQFAESLGLKDLYRLHGTLDAEATERNEQRAIVIYAKTIPKDWLSHASLSQICVVDGVEFEIGDSIAMVTDRVQWSGSATMSDNELTSLQPPIDSSYFSLFRSGFDLSKLTDISIAQRKRLNAQENTAFYALLKSNSIAASDPPFATVFQALQSPETLVAKSIQGKGRSLRVTRIALNDPSIIKKLGQDHYFEIDTQCEIGDRAIRMVRDDNHSEDETTNEAEPIIFEREFPTTLVALDLPNFLLTSRAVDRGEIEARDGEANDKDQMAESWYVNQPLKFTGRFYRMWSYESKRSDEVKQRQVAPLIMASQIAFVPTPRSVLSENIAPLTFAMIGAMVIVSISIARVAMRMNKQKKLLREKKNARHG